MGYQQDFTSRVKWVSDMLLHNTPARTRVRCDRWLINAKDKNDKSHIISRLMLF